MNTELSVVVLCYKAGQRVHGFVDKIAKLLNNTMPSWEMILVGNYLQGSNDDTPHVVKDIASKRRNVKAITLPKQGMMGWDARCGLNEASGRFVCFIDGDEQMPPEDIVRVYTKIKDEGLDFVKTYRVKRNDGIKRKLLSIMYNLLFKILFPGANVKDINSKPKIFSREAYNKMCLVSNDWFLDAEIIIQARNLNFKIGEIPSEFYKCEHRKSFVKLHTTLEFMRNLFCARINGFFK